MIKNYLILTFRSIRQNKIFTLINIIGFAVGISACLFIVLWIQDENGFDKFHSKSYRIYRVLVGESSRLQPRTPHPMAQQMVVDFPEVEMAVSMSPIWGPGLTRAEINVKYEDNVYDEKGIFSVDTTFFKIFDFPFLSGDPETALKEPGNIILTRGMAVKYFGTIDNAMGKTLKINNQLNLTINGIVENVPENSHFTFDFLVSYVSMKQLDRQKNNGKLSPYYTWDDFGHYNYLLLKTGANPEELEKRLNDWILAQNFFPLSEKDRQRVKEGRVRFVLQAMNDIHLHSNIMWELGTNGNILYVIIFFAAAMLILIMACVNFMNLATARSLKRAKEIGIRKAIGAHRQQLIIQFLTESVVLTLISSAIALLLTDLFLPVFNSFTGKELSLNNLLSLHEIWKLIVGILVVGFFSGSYPAFFLSSFTPFEVLKGRVQTGSSQLAIRKYLVIFQFVISILLIICTFVIYKQISYLQNRNLGFNQEQVLVISMKDDAVRNKYEEIRSTLLLNPDIVNVAASSNIPGGQFNQNSIRYDGNDDDKSVAETFVTSDYFDLLEIKTASGRVFTRDFTGDTTSSFVINEAAAKLYNWDTPVDKGITYYGDSYTNARGKIIGVVKDFNIHSLQQPIEPLIILLGQKSFFSYMLIRINRDNVPKTLTFIEKAWKQIDNNHAFSYSFLDVLFKSQYQGEKRMGTIFWIFALLAVFIASLGLFGLSNFMIEQRVKEIGIRKSHGASIVNILGMLVWQFAAWIIIASTIALPLGYYFAHNWLENFACRAPISVMVFILAIIITILVTLLTISYQVWNAAQMNPVDSLKYE
jgi:putative ABC transport system permease protein